MTTLHGGVGICAATIPHWFAYSAVRQMHGAVL